VKHDDYASCDATELARRVRAGEVGPAELVETAIAAIERVNPALNAVVHRLYDEARAAAAGPLPDGPLRGVPMVVKDFDGFVRGVPFTAGSRFLEGFIPDHDSEAMARLQRAGLIFLATTTCPELGILAVTEPRQYGATRNPHDPRRSPGGSSGGSGALVAAGTVPIGHGGDGGGSLRIPASHCGLVALKPTRGRVPVGPDFGEIWGGYVQWGVLTRSVRDTALVLDVMGGAMPGDPYVAPPLPRPLVAEAGQEPGRLRIGFHDGSLFGSRIHADHAAAVRQAAAALEALGHDVEEARPNVDRHALVRAYLTQVAVGVADEIDHFARMTGRTPRPSLFEPETWFLRQVGRSMTALDLQQARDAALTAARASAPFHARYELFLCATVTHPPPRIGELRPRGIERAGLSALRRAPVGWVLRRALSTLAERVLERTPNTQLFNQTGQPAISLPLGRSREGLPIGVQFAAAIGREDLLVRVAAQLEAAVIGVRS
jgi:amidase